MASSDKDTPPQSNTVAGRPVFARKECDLLLAEYNTLRTELLQRISTRYQVVSLTLIIFGTFLGFTAFGSKAIYFVLLYPGLAFFLMNVYISNTSKVKAIGEYIIAIEVYVSSNSTADVENLFRWQTTYDEQKHKSEQDHFRPPSATVIFPLTATAALAFGIFLFFVETGFNPAVTWVLIVLAALFCVLSWILKLQKTPIFRI